MKICPINSVSFKGKIIDAHVHTGKINGKEYFVSDVDTFVSKPLTNGDTVDKVIISNLSCMTETGVPNETEGNLALLKQTQGKEKYSVLAVCQPQKGNVDNIKQLFEQHPDTFAGLKFHPNMQKVAVSDEAYLPYLKFAQTKGLPCVFHCAMDRKPGVDEFIDEARQYSSPRAIYEMAKKTPDVPVIMAHMGAGGDKVHKMAVDVLVESIEKGDARLYADISWVDCNTTEKPNIINAIKRLQSTAKGDKTERLLFGSDAPIAEFDYGWYDASTGKKLSGKEYYTKTIVDVKQAIKNNFGDKAEELTDKIFYQNAQNLFFKTKNTISEATGNAEQIVLKQSGSNKIAKFAAGILVAAAAAYAFVCKPPEPKQQDKKTSVN